MTNLTAERLRELLDYNPATGSFIWKGRRGGTAHAGSIAGWRHSDSEGYLKIMIDGKRYYAHRLAWFYMNNEWPRGHLDHKDRVRSNNAIANLRIATPQQNQMNAGIYRNNKSGLKGASRDRRSQKWYGHIHVDGKSRYLGSFNTAKEAHEAYVAAARKLFGEFARAI